jgi:hypothetical protein
MSQVTNLIITFSTLEDHCLIIESMKQYRTNADNFYIVSVEDEDLPTRWYGGTRVLECNILLGAYNYLDLETFIAFLRNDVKWKAPDLVQLFVKEQEDMKFRLIDLIDE